MSLAKVGYAYGCRFSVSCLRESDFTTNSFSSLYYSGCPWRSDMFSTDNLINGSWWLRHGSCRACSPKIHAYPSGCIVPFHFSRGCVAWFWMNVPSVQIIFERKKMHAVMYLTTVSKVLNPLFLWYISLVTPLAHIPHLSTHGRTERITQTCNSR